MTKEIGFCCSMFVIACREMRSMLGGSYCWLGEDLVILKPGEKPGTSEVTNTRRRNYSKIINCTATGKPSRQKRQLHLYVNSINCHWSAWWAGLARSEELGWPRPVPDSQQLLLRYMRLVLPNQYGRVCGTQNMQMTKGDWLEEGQMMDFNVH